MTKNKKLLSYEVNVQRLKFPLKVLLFYCGASGNTSSIVFYYPTLFSSLWYSNHIDYKISIWFPCVIYFNQRVYAKYESGMIDCMGKKRFLIKGLTLSILGL